MSVSAHTSVRVTIAAGLAVATILAAAAPVLGSTTRSAVRVPIAVPGGSIMVTYRDAASFRAGGVTTAATASSRIDTLQIKVFTPRRGQEQLAMRQLADDRGVVSIENDAPVKSTTTPNDPLWAGRQQWAHDRVALRSGWSITRGSSGVVIAILDSGLETSHPEFANRVVPGYDFVENDATPNDPRGHGTMSAGAATARGNNSLGVAGGCWGCSILPVRVLDANGTGYASSVVKGIIFAANRGADVISMSFGGFSPTTAMANAVAYARSRGVVVVASAGNDGNTAPFYPAALSGVLAVVASDPWDRPYSWSNRGQWAELAAPGCFWTTRTGRTYGNFCGTSASAPLVAGIVGLMRSANQRASGTAIESALLRTATRLSYVAYGRPNAWAAIRAAQAVTTSTATGRLVGRTNTSVILRSSANTAARAIKTVPTGTALTVTGAFVSDGQDRTWAPVRTAAGQTGFVAAWLQTFSGSAVPTVNVLLRAGPSTSATSIVTVRAGTRVSVLGSTADSALRAWLKVRIADGRTGYMAAWLLKP
jgi:subtilisin family serine protease